MKIQHNKIHSAIMEFPNGSQVPVTKYLNLPISTEEVLDETHGTGKLILTDMRQPDFEAYGVRIDKPFPANTPIEITFEGQLTTIRKIVARDTAEMVRKDFWGTWSHTVELVDEVKRLEQEPVDNLTFNNPIEREYDEGAYIEWEEGERDITRL